MLKRLLRLLGTVATVESIRNLKELHIFDLVSLVENPEPKDVYMIYSITDEDVYMLKWCKYGESGKFDANPDKQVIYDFWNCQKSLYKIIGYSVKPDVLIMHSSVTELNTFAQRFKEAFNSNCPTLGLFIDPHDKHLMLIANTQGTIEDGTSTVYDVTIAPSAGISHFRQVAHVVRTKDIVNNFCLRPIEIEDLVTMFHQPWRTEVINNLLSLMFKSVIESEMKGMKYRIYARGLTECKMPKPKTDQSQQIDTPVQTK